MVTRLPTAGIYAKRDITLNEESLTGHGKTQWIYAIHFFSHFLSQRTIQEIKASASPTPMQGLVYLASIP
jgi:hypothetical protein